METLEVIYRDTSVMKYIRENVDAISHIITNVDKLEGSIYKQLTSYYENNTKRSIKRIRYLVDREIGRAPKRYRIQRAIAFSDLGTKDDFGESREFEPKDVLADVEDAAMRSIESSSIRKKIVGLASNDFENFTLNAWASGLNDTEISRTLASQFGGKFESHRTFVKRFKAKCKRKLAA